MSLVTLQQLRQKAVNKIDEGKKSYNQGATLEKKQEGYELMKQGCHDLLEYRKLETNENFRQIAQEKIITFTIELENMKEYLTTYRKQLEQFQQQQLKEQQNKNYKQEDLAEQQKQVLRTKLQKTIISEKPNVKWEDVAGLEKAKSSLKEAIVIPMKFPELFQGVRQPWKGILLYGPPGTGKTFLAKACATECDGTFFSVSSADLISKFVGESARQIKQLFAMAREIKPTIIFIDEVDSLTGNREGGGQQDESSNRVKTQFLVEMQGISNINDQVLVLGATNLPWALDPAIRRRFEKRIYIPFPDYQGRLQLLQISMGKTSNTLQIEEFEEIAKMLEGYSGSDMNTLIREASYEPLRVAQRATHFKLCQTSGRQKYRACAPSDPEGQQMKMNDIKSGEIYIPPIDYEDFVNVLPKCKPSVAQSDLKKYTDWTSEFGQEG